MFPKRQIRFSIRQLFGAMFAIALLIVVAPSLYRAAISYSPVGTKNELPDELASLIERDSQISGFRWLQGFNSRSILLIRNDEKLVRDIIKNNALQPCDHLHPYAVRMKNAIPRNWDKLDPVEGRWYTSAGFGFTNIEGVNEFLIHTTDGHGSATIYHEREF